MSGLERGPTRRPFFFLSLCLVLGAAQLLVNAVWPPLPTTDSSRLMSMCVVAAALAVLTSVAGRVRGSEPVLVAMFVLAVGLMVVVTATVAGGQGQFMAGMYILVLALIAAFYLSRRGFAIVLVAALAGFLGGLAVNPLLDTPGYAVFMATFIALVAAVVFKLVTLLRSQALHDQLTGALNRRGLEEAATRARALAARQGRESAVVEIDLDGFKHYNDEFGHAAGDDRLAQTAMDWRGVLRETDLLARIGGDEFIIVLPGATANEAEQFVGRLRAVNDVPWTAGVSTWTAGDSFAEALQRADVRMYEGKGGRPSQSGS